MTLPRKIYSSIFLVYLIFGMTIIVEKMEMMLSVLFHTDLFFFSQFAKAFSLALPLLVSAMVAYMCADRKEGISVICGIVSFLAITTLINNTTLNTALEYTKFRADVSSVYIKNILIALICGLFSSFIASRFSTLHLPNAFAFFSGKRLTPILCTVFAFPLALALYFGWMVVFWMIKNISDLLYAQGTWGMGLATAWDHALIIVGLQGITSRFYILNGMSDGMNLLAHITLPLFCLFLCYQNRHKKNICCLLLYLMMILLCSQDDQCFSLFLFLSSTWLWLLYILLIFLTTFLIPYVSSYAYLLGIGLSVIMMMAALWVIKKRQISFTWYDHLYHVVMRIQPQEIVNAMGGFDNIKSQKAEDEGLAFQLYDIDYADFSILEQMEISYRCDHHKVILFIGDTSTLYSRQLDTLMQEALNDLKL